MTQPINVVVPTRERADTLRHCLATIVAEDDDRIRIWVSDNASSPATREVVESVADPRITYMNTGERLSMSHNYEFALSRITDGWIVMIGDDDGLLPGRLVPMVEELEAAGLSAAATEPCFYNWPGAVPSEKVRLTVPLDTRTQRIGGREAIARMLDLDWRGWRMPQLYTGGIVHADIVNRVRAIRGSFFQSQIPDVFSGYAICSTVDAFLFTRRPFAIAGRSKHSIGNALFNNKKNAFLDEGLIPFHPDFPMPEGGTLTFSMCAIIYECWSQAAYLHHGNPTVSKQHMLTHTVGLDNHGPDRILAWGRQFAALHGLDFDAALRDAKPLLRWHRRAERRRKIASLTTTARLFADDPRPFGNVAEAAETANAILRHPPNRLAMAARTLSGMIRPHKSRA